MKYNTFHRHSFTGEYWDYTTSQDPIGGQPVQTYFKSKDLRCSLISAEKGTLYLLADEQLRFNAQVRVLKDPRGNLIFTNPVSGNAEVAYVGVSEPMFDVWGTIIGYRHDISQGLD